MSAPFTPSIATARLNPAVDSLPHRRSLFGKRAFDLALLLPSLPVFLPAMAALVVASKIADGGQTFFVQTRATVGGRPFSIYKLRTMTMDKFVEDRRPTRFGQWMRQRGLDELPQLLNVLKGEMSLVGPRPLLHADIDRLSAEDGLFRARLQVPPGLTGLSQVTMTTGAKDVAQVDAHYARTHSAWGDIKILCRTVVMNVVGKKRGRAKALRFDASGRRSA